MKSYSGQSAPILQESITLHSIFPKPVPIQMANGEIVKMVAWLAAVEELEEVKMDVCSD